MAEIFLRISGFVHRSTHMLCVVLFAVMAFSTLLNVLLRYGFSAGFLWLQDISLFSFALLSVLVIPLAFHVDRHVRVDLLREKQSWWARRRIDQFALMAFLLPMLMLLLTFSFGDALYSISILESSPQHGGLPFYFLVKAGLPLSALLTMIEGIALLLRPRNRGAEPNGG